MFNIPKFIEFLPLFLVSQNYCWHALASVYQPQAVDAESQNFLRNHTSLWNVNDSRYTWHGQSCTGLFSSAELERSWADEGCSRPAHGMRIIFLLQNQASSGLTEAELVNVCCNTKLHPIINDDILEIHLCPKQFLM